MSKMNNRFYPDFLDGMDVEINFSSFISLYVDTDDFANMDLSDLRVDSLGKIPIINDNQKIFVLSF
jgi:hypothetical protein